MDFNFKSQKYCCGFLCSFPVYRSVFIFFFFYCSFCPIKDSLNGTYYFKYVWVFYSACISVYMRVVWKGSIQMVFWIKTIIKDSCIKLQFLPWIFLLLSMSSSIRWQCCKYAAYQCWHIERKASIFNTSQMLFHCISYEFQEEEQWTRNDRCK